MASQKSLLLVVLVLVLLATVSQGAPASDIYTCNTPKDCVDFPCRPGKTLICLGGYCACQLQQQKFDATAKIDVEKSKVAGIKCKVLDDCKTVCSAKCWAYNCSGGYCVCSC